MAFSVLLLDEEMAISEISLKQKLEKPKRRGKREYLALGRTETMDAKKLLDEALDDEYQRRNV